MRNEQKEVAKKLKNELSHFSFSRSEEVLKKTHPKTMSEKLYMWWNKEVSISLVPVGLATLLLVSASMIPPFIQEHDQILGSREIIQIGGNYYLSDLFEEAQRR